MWEIEEHADFSRRLKRFVKKHNREVRNALDNLDTYLKTLRAGTNPNQIKRGFVHTESKGVIAVDQKGEGVGLKQLRLYIYPDVEALTLHVLLIGDKNTQAGDVQSTGKFVAGLLKDREEKRALLKKETEGESDGEEKEEIQ